MRTKFWVTICFNYHDMNIYILMESYSSDPAIQTSGSGYPPTGYVSLIYNYVCPCFSHFLYAQNMLSFYYIGILHNHSLYINVQTSWTYGIQYYLYALFNLWAKKVLPTMGLKSALWHILCYNNFFIFLRLLWNKIDIYF